jgi:3-deoxy-7-phosphoheptulonate synthase
MDGYKFRIGDNNITTIVRKIVVFFTKIFCKMTSDNRVKSYKELKTPNDIISKFPLSEKAINLIKSSRKEIADIIEGIDTRLLVIVGPCSIHDPVGAIDYAMRLFEQRELYKDKLCIVMRTYFEKPRTTVGWKGLINDPYIDGTYCINEGLEMGRELLTEITDIGMPVSVELLDTTTPQYISDCISWGAIGARTVESQIHRELASGVSFPVGFKNGTDGRVDISIDGMISARNPHNFLGITKEGKAAITMTEGNKYTHIILRGSKTGTNYSKENISKVVLELESRGGVCERVLVDCSHGNSRKDYRNQSRVIDDIILQKSKSIMGVMIESNIQSGKQDIDIDVERDSLEYGKSITDECVDWCETLEMLRKLSES